MRLNSLIRSFVFLGVLLVFVACKSTSEPHSQSAQSYKQAYEVTDDEGNKVRMPHKPERIFATHFHLENMVLGVVPQERVVAISNTMDDEYVSYVRKGEFDKPKRVGYSVPLETVIAFKPDLIIARGGMGKEQIQSFRDLGFPVYISNMPLTIEEMKDKIRGIAAVTGEPEHGKTVISKIDEVLDIIKKRVPEKLAYTRSCLLVSKMNHNYGGKGCMFDDICKHAGIRNAAADIGINNGELISKEVMLKANPDYFILSVSWELRNGNADTYKEEFSRDPALSSLPAVRNNHVMYIPDRYLYVSNQNCIWAIKKLSNIVYGDIFPEEEEYFIKGY